MKPKQHLYPALLLAAILVPLIGCGTPNLSEDEASNQIAENLAAGNIKDAEKIFDGIDGSDHHVETVYATVYDRAGSYYRKDRYKEAINLLRFLHEHYPDAGAPRLALLYAHFLQRGRTRGAPDRKLRKEFDGLIKEIRKADDEKYPAWVDLAAAQSAVDAGKTGAARKEYGKFKSKWDGKPREMRFYVEEFDRYFRTQDQES